MTYTIDTVQDLVSILDEHPQWLEALRARLLTRALLEMPERLAQLTERMDQLARRMDQLTERMDQFASETRQNFATTNRRIDRVIDDLGTIKGVHAQNVTHKEAALLAARLGLQLTRSLSAADLLRITGSADTSDIPANVLSSFHRADLVVEAAGPEGDPCYVAVEASYTINGRDTERALRNARFLTEFTGRRCYAAVSGYRLDDRVRQHVDSGEVFWYQLDMESLQAD